MRCLNDQCRVASECALYQDRDDPTMKATMITGIKDRSCYMFRAIKERMGGRLKNIIGGSWFGSI